MKHIHLARTIVISLLTCLLISCQKEPKTIAVTGITLSQTSVELTEGESTRIIATISPNNATNKTVIWSSDNPYVTVSDGTITGTKPCTATVTAKSDDGGKTATCSVTVKSKVIQVSGVTLDKSELTLTEGDTQSLTATVSPENATDKSVTWSSDNESVAMVSSTGVVIAKSDGRATITVKTNDGEKSAICTVTVKAKVIAVTGVSLDRTSLTMTEGDTQTLTATVSPSNATDKSVTWTSNNTTVATVSSSGVVTAKTPGTATITVKTNDGSKTATCTVTVKAKVISVTGVSLNRTSLTMTEGDTQTLTATVSPSNATDKSVTWSSNNTSIAYVSTSGVVSAKTMGTAVITVTTNDGGKKAECQVIVKEPEIATSISLKGIPSMSYVGDKFNPNVEVKPDDAVVDLEWSVSDESIAQITGEGLSVELLAKDYGPSIISVRDKRSNLTASSKMSAGLTDFYWKENTGLTRKECPLVEIEVGEEHQLLCHYTPENATRIFRLDMYGFWYYEPYNSSYEEPANNVNSPSFFTIDHNGKIKGVKEGFAKIKVYSPVILNKAKDLYIHVVKKHERVKGVSLPESVDILEGGSATITATFTPSDASHRELTWSCSDNSVVSLSDYYSVTKKLTALKVGTAVITVKADDGGYTATCTVSVRKDIPVTSVTLNKTELKLNKGAIETLIATVNPNNATDKKVTWSSSNTGIATVDQNGKVTAVGGGSATIIAKAGDKKATCTVTVTVPVSSVTLNKSELKMKKGTSETLTATVGPDDATNKTVVWSSSNTKVATVDQNGKVTAVDAGTATITVTTNDGSKKATCKVTVPSSGNTEPIVDDGNEQGWD